MQFKTWNIFLLIGLLIVIGCDQAATEPKPADTSQVKTILDSLDLSEVAPLDLDGFIGEKLVLQGSYSNHLKQVNVHLEFPENHKLLPKARPDFLVYDANGQPLYKQLIVDSHSQFAIAKNITTSKAFLKLGVYYCKQGEEGLCMMQNMLYEIFVSEKGRDEVIDIEFELPASYF